jgi:hypothetical protein
MTFAATLAAAAGQSYDDLALRSIANQVKSRLTVFCSQNLSLFPESQPTAHPVSNWLTILSAIADQLPGANITLTQLTQAAKSLYGLCWMASFLQGSGGITVSQGNTLLASYNANIAFP